MKNILVLLAILMASNNLQSQFKKDPVINLQNEDKALFNFGYYLGLNQYDYQFEYNDFSRGRNNLTDVLVDKGPGFNVGLIGEMRLNEFLDLRFEPGLLFAQRTLLFPCLLYTSPSPRDS